MVTPRGTPSCPDRLDSCLLLDLARQLSLAYSTLICSACFGFLNTSVPMQQAPVELQRRTAYVPADDHGNFSPRSLTLFRFDGRSV